VESLFGTIVAAMWLLWLAYWWYSSRGTKVTARSETAASRASHVMPLLLAGYLMSVTRLPFSHLSTRLYHPRTITSVLMVVAVGTGLAFASWARIHLGRNWSGIVTVKDDHELVRSGPYRLVRHPIYTGLIAAFAGTAVGQGTWTGLVAVGLVIIAFTRKLRIEEQFMTAQFGEAYARYQREVPALWP